MKLEDVQQADLGMNHPGAAMGSALAEQRPWSLRRWACAVAMIFGLQVLLILWLAERGPARPRPVRSAPTLKLATQGSSELLALDDPTLFALPHQVGFSGPAWLEIPVLPDRPFEWSETPRWLTLPRLDLATTLSRFAETNSADAPPAPSPTRRPELALAEVGPLPIAPALSSWRIEGELAARKLTLAPSELPSWQAGDILTNSMVEALVDVEGWPVAIALLSGSGSKDADDFALAQTRKLRFESLSRTGAEQAKNRDPLAHLTWGALVFEWHTIPVAATNAPGK